MAVVEKINFRTNDDKLFTVDVDVIKLSATINHLLEDLGVKGKSEPTEEDTIPLPNVHSEIMEKILVWAEHHKNDPLALKKEDDDDISKFVMEITEWDKDFMKVPDGVVFAITLAANYLDIRYLLDICTKTISELIRGNTIEGVRKRFNIDPGFAPGEEEKVREENRWCEDRSPTGIIGA